MAKKKRELKGGERLEDRIAPSLIGSAQLGALAQAAQPSQDDDYTQNHSIETNPSDGAETSQSEGSNPNSNQGPPIPT